LFKHRQLSALLSQHLLFWQLGAQTTFAAVVTTGRSRSQIFTSDGQLLVLFATQLLNILTGAPPTLSQCKGLATASMWLLGAILANNGVTMPG
jgi:hypothetical protein